MLWEHIRTLFPMWGGLMESFPQRSLMFKLRCEVEVCRGGGLFLVERTSCAKKQESGSGEFRELKGAYCEWRLSVKGRMTGYETGALSIPKGSCRPLEEIWTVSKRQWEPLKHFRQGSDIITFAFVMIALPAMWEMTWGKRAVCLVGRLVSSNLNRKREYWRWVWREVDRFERFRR